MSQEPNYQVVTLEDFLEATKHLDQGQEVAADFYTMDGRAYDMKTGSPTGRIMFTGDRQHDAIRQIQIRGKRPEIMILDDLMGNADFAALEQRLLEMGADVHVVSVEHFAAQNRGQCKPNMQAALYRWLLGIDPDAMPDPVQPEEPPKKRMPYYHGRRRF